MRKPGFIGHCEKLDALPIDRKQRFQVSGLGGFRHDRRAIVEDKPTAGVTNGKHGMVLPCRSVPNQQKSQVRNSDAGLAKQDVFGDRVVLAVAATACESCKRRRPEIGNAVLDKVAGVNVTRELGQVAYRPASLILLDSR
jgi:hypothetical protein